MPSEERDDPVMSAWFARSFDALTVPQFRILWFGTLFAFLSFMMSWTVQSVVAFDLEGTNKAVGLVALGSGVSMLIVGPFGGVLADRFSKRLLLLLGQSMVGLSFLVLGLLTWRVGSHCCGWWCWSRS